MLGGGGGQQQQMTMGAQQQQQQQTVQAQQARSMVVWSGIMELTEMVSATHTGAHCTVAGKFGGNCKFTFGTVLCPFIHPSFFTI